jgi:hypothetical protein
MWIHTVVRVPRLRVHMLWLMLFALTASAASLTGDDHMLLVIEVAVHAGWRKASAVLVTGAGGLKEHLVDGHGCVGAGRA